MPVRTCVVSFKDSTSISASVVEVIKFGVDDKHMTADERRIANAAVGAGPWDSHNQIVTAVTNLLKLEPRHVESVLQRLRIRMVLVCVSAANATSENASVRYERGMDWTDKSEERRWGDFCHYWTLPRQKASPCSRRPQFVPTQHNRAVRRARPHGGTASLCPNTDKRLCTAGRFRRNV